MLSLFIALQHRGRYCWLWVAALLHGLVTESVSYFLPDIDNFWHAQSMMMLMKQRLPLHIMLFCEFKLCINMTLCVHLNDCIRIRNDYMTFTALSMENVYKVIVLVLLLVLDRIYVCNTLVYIL